MFVSDAANWWLSAFLAPTEISQPVNNSVIGCFVRARSKQITRFSKRLEPERKLATTALKSWSQMASYVALPTRNLDDQKPSNSLVNGGESCSTTCEHSWGTTASPQAHIYRVWLKRHRGAHSQHIAQGTHTHAVCCLASLCYVCPACLSLWYRQNQQYCQCQQSNSCKTSLAAMKSRYELPPIKISALEVAWRVTYQAGTG